MSESDPSNDAAASTDEKILYTTKSGGRIAYITLNNPTKQNAVDKDMIMRLLDVLHQADEDRKVKVIVINSTGDRAFCAGWDLTMFKSPDMSYNEVVQLLLTYGRDISRTIFFMKKPVVCQMQGSAIGLGCYMSLAADFRIVARKDDVFFQLPEMQVNLPGATGPTVNSIAIMGLARSKRMMLTCEKIGLEELDKWGVITKICEPADLDVEVKKFCLNMVEKNSLLISTQKMMCNLMGMAETRSYYDLENEVADYFVTNVGNDHPDDLDDFIRNLWSKYGHGTPF
jgi:enoyl-CoA hydratase/carnithine racemase